MAGSLTLLHPAGGWAGHTVQGDVTQGGEPHSFPTWPLCRQARCIIYYDSLNICMSGGWLPGTEVEVPGLFGKAKAVSSSASYWSKPDPKSPTHSIREEIDPTSRWAGPPVLGRMEGIYGHGFGDCLPPCALQEIHLTLHKYEIFKVDKCISGEIQIA